MTIIKVSQLFSTSKHPVDDDMMLDRWIPAVVDPGIRRWSLCGVLDSLSLFNDMEELTVE